MITTTSTRPRKEWRIVHEWRAEGEVFTIPYTEASTQAAAIAWCDRQLATRSDLEPGEGFFVRDPQGYVIHKAIRPA